MQPIAQRPPCFCSVPVECPFLSPGNAEMETFRRFQLFNRAGDIACCELIGEGSAEETERGMFVLAEAPRC